MTKDDFRPLLLPVCSDTMEIQCWGTDGPFAVVRTGQGEEQAKDPEMRAEPRHRGQVLAIEPI